MKLVRSARAQRELDEAADYLLSESPAAARLFAERIDNAFENLKTLPTIGTETDISTIYGYVLTKIRYKIFYRIIDDTISIESVFHTSQNPDKISG